MPGAVELTSRIVRATVVSGGARKIKANPFTSKGVKGFFGQLAGGLLQVVSGLFSGLAWTFTGLWSAIVMVSSFIMNFNWNITDKEIDDSIDQSFAVISGLLGQAAGRALGVLVCGAVPTAAVFMINPNIGKAIAPRITEQLLEQLAREYEAIIYQSGRMLLNSGFLWLYGSVRRAFRGSDDDLKARLKKAGANEEKIKQELETRHKPFILSQIIQERIDNIKDEKRRAFVDQAYQEFGVACTEAGYVVAGALDAYIYQKNLVAAEATVEIDFDEQGKARVNKIS